MTRDWDPSPGEQSEISMRRWWLSLAAMLGLSLLISVATVAGKHRVRIACDPWPPWMEGDEGGDPTGGVFVRITDEVFDRANLKYEITVFPFKRCLQQMKNGERDAMLMVSKSQEREAFMAFTDVVLRDSYYIYYSTESVPSFEWNDWRDLKGSRIGVVRGFHYGDGLKEAEKKYGVQTEEASNDIQNVKKLMAGRFDFIVLSKINADAIFRDFSEFRGKIRAADNVFHERQYSFGFSRKSPFISSIPAINEAIQSMMEDGSWENIVRENLARSVYADGVGQY